MPPPTTTSLMQALRQSELLVEVPKFSKFLHGMALTYPQGGRGGRGGLLLLWQEGGGEECIPTR